MVRKFDWFNVMMALALSIGLLVSIAHLAHAHPSQPRCDLTVNFAPYLDGQYVSGLGTLSCQDSVKEDWLTVQLQQYKDGNWVTLKTENQISDAPLYNTLKVSALCPTKEQTLYRVYVTGQYRTDSEWQTLPTHAEKQNLLSCE